jgi:hypothetical protein
MKETGADQLRGTAKRTAERAIDKEVTQFGKTFERDVRAKTQAFQRAQQAKAQKGTTPGSRAKMAADVARRPRVQGPKPPATTTTGTRRVAANPPTNSGRGVRGRVVEPYQPKNTQGPVDKIRTLRKGSAPATNKTGYGERTPINLTESQVRQGASNPAPTRPTGRTGTQVRQPKGGNPVESFSPKTRKATALQGRPKSPNASTSIEDNTSAYKNLSPGERARYSPGLEGPRTPQRDPGRPIGGVRPTDGRGSTTPTQRTGSATSDSRQTRANPNGKTDRLARLGQPVPRNGINTNNPVVQQRAAAAKAAEKALPKQPAKAPTPPKRTAEQEAALRRQSRRNTEAARQATTNDPRKSAQLQRDWNNKLEQGYGVAPGTTKSGEVRLQGSAKGNQHMTGIDSGSRDGKVPKTGPHDGTVSRQVATKQATDADRKAVKAVKARNASDKANAVVNAAKKGVDRFGNNLQKTADDLLRSIGWTGN